MYNPFPLHFVAYNRRGLYSTLKDNLQIDDHLFYLSVHVYTGNNYSLYAPDSLVAIKFIHRDDERVSYTDK